MNSETKGIRDPVCGMTLTPGQVKESLDFNGRTYAFCSVGCRAEFQRHPEDYARSLEAGVPPSNV